MGIAIRLGERFLRVSERSRRVGILHRAKTRALGALLGQQPTVGRGHKASADRFFQGQHGIVGQLQAEAIQPAPVATRSSVRASLIPPPRAG